MIKTIRMTIFISYREPFPAETEEFGRSAKKVKIAAVPSVEEKKIVCSKLQHASPMTFFHLRPKKFIDRSLEVRINPAEFIKEITDLDGMMETLEDLKKANSSRINRSQQYPKVVFLGTGSCIPNKTRNVSSILVHTK